MSGHPRPPAGDSAAPMKLGLVSTYMPPHPGGIEQAAANTFEAYRRVGIDLRWVTSRIPRTLAPASGPVTRVPCFNAVEDRLGVPVPVWGWTAWRVLRETCAWADVVHVIDALYVPSAMAVAAARLAGKPVVLSQNVGEIPYGSRALRAAQRVAWTVVGRPVLRGADTVVLATPAADTFVRRMMGARLRQSARIPNGIDTDFFRPPTEDERTEARRTLDLEAGRSTVLFAGRLVEKKGVPLVVEAAVLSAEVTFLVAGDGPLRPLLRGAPANVRWLGYVDSLRMRQLYRATDAVLLPSRGEGLPIFVQEAMACGLPAIVSDDEEYAAPLVDAGLCHAVPRRAAAIAATIPRAVAVPPSSRRRIRAWAESEWGLDRMAGRYLEVVQALRAAGRNAAC